MAAYQPTNEIADALRDVLQSPNVCDSNFEVANIVDVADRLARSITSAAEMLSGGLHDVAAALRERV